MNVTRINKLKMINRELNRKRLIKRKIAYYKKTTAKYVKMFAEKI